MFVRSGAALLTMLAILSLPSPIVAAPPLEATVNHEMAAAPREDEARLGTGFFVSDDGYILTAAHVVAGCRHLLELSRTSEETSPATLIALDARLDAAVLQVAGAPSYTLDLASDDPRPDDRLIMFTANDARPFFVPGTIERTEQAGGESLLVMVPDLKPGASGSPVLDGRAHVVGMSIGRTDGQEQTTLVMRGQRLRSFLIDAHVIAPNAGVAGLSFDLFRRDRRLDQIGLERLRDAIVQIRCT